MALHDILQSIQTNAQKEIDQITKEAEEKKRAQALVWEKKIQARKDAVIAQTHKKSDNEIRQARFLITLQKNSEILKKKQEIINTVYGEAAKTLGRLSDKMYMDVIQKLMKDLPNVKGQIHSVADDRKKRLLQKALKGRKHTLSEEDIKGSGGFIFTSQEIDIDNTFESLVKNIKDETQTEVAKILFS